MKAAAKCMAFAPQQRCKNAQAVKRALLHALPQGRVKSVLLRCALGLGALCALTLLGLGLGRIAAAQKAGGRSNRLPSGFFHPALLLLGGERHHWRAQNDADPGLWL